MNKEIQKQKESLLGMLEKVKTSKYLYHSTFDDFTDFDFSKSDFGMHFGTKESALNRISLKIEECQQNTFNTLGKKINNPILLKVELDYSNPLKLKENRLGQWTPYDILREVIEQAEDVGVKGITEDDIEDYYSDELSLNGISFVDVGWEEEYDGANNEHLKEHYFVRNWLESKGYDSVIYENKFEKGGESIMILRPEQIKIVDKIYLNQENKIENNNRKKIKP